MQRSRCSLAFGFGALLSGIIAFAQASEARIVYTSVNESIHGGGSLSIDVNGDGVTDFTIDQYFSWNPPCMYVDTTVVPSSGNGVVWSYTSPVGEVAAAVPMGVYIGPFDTYITDSAILKDIYGGAGCPFGHDDGFWGDGNPHYFGFAFLKNGKTRYGWAQATETIAFNRFAHSVTTTLSGYAYQTIIGRAIPAGKT